MIRVLWFLACWLGLTTSGWAQGAGVRVTADTNILVIGGRVKLHFEMSVPPQATVKFPAWADTLDGFEITSRGKIDTTENADRSLTLRQDLELTRFDSGYYVIQPVPFLYKDIRSAGYDSVFTEALLLTVTTIAVDTTRAIRDIKPPMDVPFTFRELLPYLLGFVGMAVLTVITVLLLRRKRATPSVLAPRIPSVPPHDTALKALKQLAEEKLWQQGLFKQYHTRLADIVRVYIEERFQVLAMEQTSDEILHSLAPIVPREGLSKLESLMRLADLVKFARLHPFGPENETSLVQAREFIELTQPVVPAGASGKEETS